MNNLGDTIKQRRLALGLKQSDAAQLAGVTVRTYGRIERSEAAGLSSLTAAGIERALQWGPGSLDAIKNGGEPTELQQPPETAPVVKQPLPQPGAGDGVGELRQAIRDLDSLPGYVQRVVLDQAVDELPRAIAALDDERRGRLVRYAFALWDEMGGMASPDGADNAGASHGSSNQRGDAGCADHAGDAGAAGVAGDSAASPDADPGYGISGFNDHREGA